MDRVRITQSEAERRLKILRPEMVRRAGALLSAHDAEDAVQEATFYCWEVAEQLYDDREGELGFEAWAMTVLMRRVRTMHSRRSGQVQTCPLWEDWDREYESYEDMEKGSFVERHTYRIDDVLDRIEREEARVALADLMGRAKLSERQEEVVRLILADESTREIAARLGISVKCVNAHLAAAKAKMVAARGAHEGEEAHQ